MPIVAFAKSGGVKLRYHWYRNFDPALSRDSANASREKRSGVGSTRERRLWRLEREGHFLQHQMSYNHLIRLYIAGCAASTNVDPLINAFLGYGYKQILASNASDSDFRTHWITVDEETIKLQLWNLYGVGYFGLPLALFRGHLIGLMVLYNVAEERSFERAKELIKSAQQMNQKRSIVLVGCHYPGKKEREVEYYTAREFADERDIPAIEISCGRRVVNVELAFMTLIASVLSNK